MGAILASIATTLPEISVSIISSFQGKGSLALGNALGSVLFNIAVILGISSVF
ncbi:MAG: sodium:calcium antiporter, partial [Brevinematia bacterium]